MTTTLTFGKLAALFKNNAAKDCGRPEAAYPLYWLAPHKDLGVRRVSLSSLTNIATSAPKRVQECNIYHYPQNTGLVKYLLSFLGIECSGKKDPAVRVIKICGKFFVEQGHKALQIALALGLDYVSVKLVEYNYENLRKRMQLLKYPDVEIVAIATGQKGSYSYQGISPEHAAVLLKDHRVPLADHTVVEAKACSGAGPVPGSRSNRAGRQNGGNRPKLTLVK